MPDDMELDLSDLMAPDTTADDANDAIDDANTQTADDLGTDEPAPSADLSEVDRIKAENAALKQHVDNLLSRLQPQQAAQAPVEDNVPDIDTIASQFDATTRPFVTKMLQQMEQRVQAALKKYTPRAEWDAAQPVLQNTVLRMDEQNAQAALRQQGVTDQQIAAAKAEMDKMINAGKRFSDYESAYQAGLGRVFMAERQGKAKATVAARAEKQTRAATADNTIATTPAEKGSLKVGRDEVLNSPFDVLDKLRQAGV